MEAKTRWNKAKTLALAGDLADQFGLEPLTLTRLAEAMGVRTPSVFNHVEGRDGLVLDLARDALETLAQRLEAVQALALSPEEELTALLGAYRAFVKAHPGRYAATLAVPRAVAFADPALSSSENRIVGAGLRVAARFGLSGAEALHVLRGWRALAHGFSDLERQGGFGLPLDLDESWQRAIANLLPIHR